MLFMEMQDTPHALLKVNNYLLIIFPEGTHIASGTIYQCQYKSFVVQNCKRMNQKKMKTGNDGCSGTAIAETTAIAD